MWPTTRPRNGRRHRAQVHSLQTHGAPELERSRQAGSDRCRAPRV